MTARAVDYYSAGSCDGHSVANNKESFRKCRLVPRVLRDVSSIRPQTMIFGIESPLPIYVAPASNAVLGHPDGELNITQGVRAGFIVHRRMWTKAC
jgi:L-lactate dehydrogenase (cytochrome)